MNRLGQRKVPVILIISSTKENNLKLAEQINEVCQESKIQSSLISLEDYPMPLYTPSYEEDKGVPEEAHLLAKKLNEAKGLIFCAPEYNGTLPPILNNAIAWISRTDDSNWRSSFNGKFSVVATHSGGGGAKVLNAMRAQLEHLGSIVLPRTILTTYSTPMKVDSVKAIVEQLNSYIN